MGRVTLLRNQSLKELDAVSRKGVLAIKRVASQVELETVRAFRAKRLPKVKRILDLVLRVMLRDATIAAYLTGYRRSQLVAAKSGKLGLQLAVFDEVLTRLTKNAGLSQDELREQYQSDAFTIAADVSEAVEKQLQKSVRELISSGAHVREGIQTLREEFARVGLKGVKPYRLEAIFRTQTQLAYGAGKWQANQDPAIQEILWGYEYSTVGDDRVRDSHVAVDEVRLPKDDPFWEAWWPPNGWNCRCQAIPIFDDEGEVKPPEDAGNPDEGFTFNAGTEKVAPKVVRRRVKAKEVEKVGQAKTVAEAVKQAEKLLARQTETYPEGLTFLGSELSDIGMADYAHFDVGRANFSNEMLAKMSEESDKLGIPRVRGVKPPANAGHAATMGDGLLGMGRLGNDETFYAEDLGKITVNQPILKQVVASDEIKKLTKFIAQEKDPFAKHDLESLKAFWEKELVKRTADTGPSVKYDTDIVYRHWKWGDERALRPHNAKDYFTDGEKRRQSTYWHEFGHHVEQSQSKDFQLKLSETYERLRLDSLGGKPGQDVARSATGYGDSNEHEWFAENFTLFKQGRRDLVHPKAQKLIDEVYENVE